MFDGVLARPAADIAKALKKFSEPEAILIERSLRSGNPVIEVAHSEKPTSGSQRRSKRRMATQQIDIPDDDNPSPDELPRDLMDQLLENE